MNNEPEKKQRSRKKLVPLGEVLPSAPLPIVRQEPVSIASMMQAVIDKGVTADNVVALEKLCGLYERMKAKDAEQQFNIAFARLQKEMPRVAATEPVHNKDGSVRYRFAPFEDLMKQVQTFLSDNGFSVSFNTRVEGDRLVSFCTLRHTSGHATVNEFAIRIGNGPPGSTVSQADMAAKTYAKRGALCDALNIVVEGMDDDQRNVGKPVGKALGEDLQTRCVELGVDMEAFLKYAGAANFESIPDAMFPRLDAMLKRKAQQRPEAPHVARDDEPKDPKTGEYLW